MALSDIEDDEDLIDQEETDQDQQAEDEGHAEVDPEIERRARRKGWRPIEEFNGDKSKWVDAATFLRRGEESLPLALAENRRLESQMAELIQERRKDRQEIEAFRNDFKSYRDRAEKAEERAYKRALAEIEEQRRKAVEYGDVPGFEKAEQARKDLEENYDLPKFVKEPPSRRAKSDEEVEEESRRGNTGGLDPDTKAWIDQNSWFNADEDLRDYAVARDATLARRHPGMSVKERLALVKDDTRKAFPDKFSNPRRDDPPSVGAPSTRSDRAVRSKAKTFENLPQQARTECDRQFRTLGAGMTQDAWRKEYCKYYEWEN